MKFKGLSDKLWFNVFIRIAAIFLTFVLVLAISNVSFLVGFFSLKEKNELKNQIVAVSRLDMNDSAAVTEKLSQINDKYNFDVEIYNLAGKILYTTHGGQMMDYFTQNNDKFIMAHDEMKVIKTEELSGGITFQVVERRFDKSEHLLCKKELGNGLIAEVRIRKQLINNSASVANEFMLIIASVCFAASLVWVFIFAKKFSKPIAEMNEITKDIANLNFSRKLKINRDDEIGQLANSVNELSISLDSALTELVEANEKLKSDIELERQLDVMRRGFVANVSHELKTPISIISGYAEGLKLNINEESKNEYINVIVDESERMNRLVLGILQLSKYESGQAPLSLERFNISKLCDESLKRIFENKNINFENKINENLEILADPLQIEQVLKAYLENAAAHTPENGSVWTESSIIDSKVRISVFNTGSGVDEEIMPEIWQSFFRGDKSHKRDNTRFGLGLSIVSAIMKLHKNKCGVYNTDSGVCFWFEADKA